MSSPHLVGKQLHSFTGLVLHGQLDGAFLQKIKLVTNSVNIKVYLGVKGVPLQLVVALELQRVGLSHRQVVLRPLKDLGLVHFQVVGPCEVAFF